MEILPHQEVQPRPLRDRRREEGCCSDEESECVDGPLDRRLQGESLYRRRLRRGRESRGKTRSGEVDSRPKGPEVVEGRHDSS